MFRANIVFISIGFVAGIIISNLIATSNQSNIKTLSAELRSEIRALGAKRTTSQQSSQVLLSPTHDITLDTGAQENNLDEIKLAFREIAEDLKKEQLHIMQQLIAQNDDNHAQSDDDSETQLPLGDDEKIAVEQTSYILQDAISTGTWDESSAELYANALRKLPAQEQYEARVRLSQAINDGQLTIDNAMNMMF